MRQLKGEHRAPIKNRSCKHLNMLIGNASVFPAYKGWSNENLKKYADRCQNPMNNCFYDELLERAARRKIKEQRRLNIEKNKQK